MRLLAVILAALALSSCGDSARTVDRCPATLHGDWNNDCRSVYATTDIAPSPGYEPVTHVLKFDGARFRVFVAITRSRYERFFTDRPATQLVIDGNEYVADPNFFFDEGGGAMRIGTSDFGLTWDGSPQLVAASGDTGRIREALEGEGGEVTVAYSGTMDGRVAVRLPASGFSDAVANFD